MINKTFIKTILKVVKNGNEASVLELGFVPEVMPNEKTEKGLLTNEMIKALIVRDINEKDFSIEFIKLRVYKLDDGSVEDEAIRYARTYTYKEIFEYLNQGAYVEDYATYSLLEVFLEQYLKNFEAENIVNVKRIGAITQKSDRELLVIGKEIK